MVVPVITALTATPAVGCKSTPLPVLRIAPPMMATLSAFSVVTTFTASAEKFSMTTLCSVKLAPSTKRTPFTPKGKPAPLIVTLRMVT